MHGVFPSCHCYSASAQRIQIHWINIGDSGEVVTPFMQVETYSTRNFATLEPSELQLPFTEGYILGFYTYPFNCTVPGRYQTLYFIIDLAESCVFTKQSLPLLLLHLLLILIKGPPYP